MGSITITGLRKVFRSKSGEVAAIDDLDLEVQSGELLVLLGPSGCGKTTTLRALAGLETADTGRIRFGDDVVFDAKRRIDVRPNKRDIGMVFQSFALWPHMTVRRNIAYPLRARGRRDGMRAGWVDAAAQLVDCGALLDRYPSQLSGGQQQRVALARALVARPAVLLFDEPLSNLDAKLRDQLRADLHRLHRELGFTGVYVTHDQDEALALGDRLAIMRSGRIEQLDAPETVFSRPRTDYVASFIGIDNVINLIHAEGRWSSPAGALHGTLPDADADVTSMRVRRDDVKLYSGADELGPGEMGIEGATVVDVSFAGRQRAISFDLGGRRLFAVLDLSEHIPVPGERVVVGLKSSRALMFDAAGELIVQRDAAPIVPAAMPSAVPTAVDA